MNDNPLQFVPIELTECRKLSVLDLSHTYVKILPIETALLKNLFDLNLEGCPLKTGLAGVYTKGIVAVLKYYDEKMERERLRGLIIKACKEQLWVDKDTSEITEVIGKVFDSLEADDIYLLKRLLRNLKYMLPESINSVDPYQVKQNLTTSRAEARTPESTMNRSISKSMRPVMNQTIRLYKSDTDIQQSIIIQGAHSKRSELASISEVQLGTNGNLESEQNFHGGTGRASIKIDDHSHRSNKLEAKNGKIATTGKTANKDTKQPKPLKS